MFSVIRAYDTSQSRDNSSLRDLHAVPEVVIFSSNKAYAQYKFRESHPILFRMVKIIWEVVKVIFRIICIPLGLFWILEKICQNMCTPSTGGIITEPLCQTTEEVLKQFRYCCQHQIQNQQVKTLRTVPIQCDDLLIDTLEITFPKAKPDRWVLFAPGQTECFEHRMIVSSINWAKDIAELANANILMMNYPGVMRSKGEVSLESLVKSHSACVHYLRDHPQGPRAKQIVAYGYSLGTAIQSVSLEKEVLDGSDDVHWMVIQDRAPRSLAAVAKEWFGILGNWLGKCAEKGIQWARWNVDTEAKSKTLVCPELLIYNCDANGMLLGDGMFSRDTCLASAFINKEREDADRRKIFVGVYDLNHVGGIPISFCSQIAKEITGYFERFTEEIGS